MARGDDTPGGDLLARLTRAAVRRKSRVSSLVLGDPGIGASIAKAPIGSLDRIITGSNIDSSSTHLIKRHDVDVSPPAPLSDKLIGESSKAWPKLSEEEKAARKRARKLTKASRRRNRRR